MKRHRISILILAFFCATCTVSYSQSSSLSGVQVHGGCSMSFFGAHQFDFGSCFAQPGVITTSRLAGNRGLIYFSAGSSWSGANELQYIDGYAVNATGSAFTFPIGQNGFYKPAGVTASAVTAAYYNADPSTVAGSTTSSTLSAISSTDVWAISGSNSSGLTLSWDANSAIGALTGSDLTNLSIIGWNGTQWDVIASTVDANVLDINSSGYNFTMGTGSTLMEGSISTNSNIDLDAYQYFSLGSMSAPFAQFAVANNGYDKEPIEIFFYPNPATSFDDLTIVYTIKEFKGANLEIYDLTGQVLYKQTLTNSMGVEKVDFFPHQMNGSYLIGINTVNGTKKVKKAIIVE